MKPEDFNPNCLKKYYPADVAITAILKIANKHKVDREVYKLKISTYEAILRCPKIPRSKVSVTKKRIEYFSEKLSRAETSIAYINAAIDGAKKGVESLRILLLVCALTVSCASVRPVKVETKLGGDVVEIAIDDSVVIDMNTVETIAVSKDKELFEVSKFFNFSKDEINKFYHVTKKHDETVNSQCFMDFMSTRGLLKTNGRTPGEVVTHLRSEKPLLEFQMYYSLKGVVGYTYPNSRRIWMNRRLHGKMSPCERSANIGHERSHKLRYEHSLKRHSKRKYSVPYAINDAFKKCCIKQTKED